jgi:hypothetical protein
MAAAKKTTTAKPKPKKPAPEKKAPAEPNSKLHSFLTENKLNPKRLIAVSHTLEQHQKEDRTLRLERRRSKKAEGGEKKEIAKPRSGRPVTPRALTSALTGGTLSGPTKQRILRAVNYLLEQKKKDKVELKTLF